MEIIIDPTAHACPTGFVQDIQAILITAIAVVFVMGALFRETADLEDAGGITTVDTAQPAVVINSDVHVQFNRMFALERL